jgi:Ca2+-binding RTX toxin-like protein
MDSVLVWDHGNLRIEGSEVGVDRSTNPNENFDFQASNSAAQLINENFLAPSIDPYGIGRQVAVTFSDTPGKIHTVYDASTFVAEQAAANESDYSQTFDAYSSAAVELAKELHDSGVVEYQDDGGRLIVYGVIEDDVLSRDSVKVPIWYEATLFGDYGIAVASGAGNDTIIGTNFGDVIYAGSGDDAVIAGSGNNTLDGGDGNDTIIGGDGLDTIYGGAGDDIIYAGFGDTLYGGDGVDTFFFSSERYASNPNPYWRTTIFDLEDHDKIFVDGLQIKG